MKESFNPSGEEYKKVEDLHEEHQGEFTDVPEEIGGGFVNKEAMEKLERVAVMHRVKADKELSGVLEVSPTFVIFLDYL